MVRGSGMEVWHQPRHHPKGIPVAVSCLLLFTICLTYWNCLLCSFVFDDVSAIKENRDLRPNAPLKNVFLNDFWGTPMSKEQSHKSYRPLCVLTFRLNYLLHGLQPLGYHLINLLLHCIVCLLFFKVARLWASQGVSLLASMLFAVHPIHTEAVTGVVGRAELLSSIFFLLAILNYHSLARRPRQVWRSLLLYCLFVTLAMFSKEQGITVLGVTFAYEILVVQGFSLASLRSSATSMQNLSPFFSRSLVMFITGVSLLLVRFYVMGSTLPVFTNFDNPASYESSPVKQLTFAYLIAVNSWLLVNPSDLCCDWTMGTIPLVRTLGDPRNLFTILTFVILLHLAFTSLTSQYKRQRHVVGMGLALIVFPFLPASNLFFPVGFVVAERILYLPSMGFCLLVAYGFKLLITASPSRKTIFQVLALVLIMTHGLKTFVRNFDWQSEQSIFMSGLKVNKGNAKLFNNVGHALEAKENYEQALRYFQAAVAVQKDDVGAHINVGRTFFNLKRFLEAEEAYYKAKALLPQAKPGQKYTARIAPQHLSVFLNLANLISKDPTRLEEADVLYRQAISMRRDYVQAYINRGDILIKMNRSDEALEVYEQALTYDSTNPDLYYNLGVVHLEQGKAQQALAYFDKAIEIDPDHLQALMNSAILIQESGSAQLRPRAYQRLFKVMEVTPDSERVYFNLGMLAMDDLNYQSAERWFRKAIELKRDFRSALFNLALLLNEQKRPLEAIPFLKMLLSSHPDHVKGLVLLGDIYTNHVRDFNEAEKCYQRIITIDPDHVQAHHNLCVVKVEQGDLAGAEACLRHVQLLAPTVDYIQRHLEIVQNRIKSKQELGEVDGSDDKV